MFDPLKCRNISWTGGQQCNQFKTRRHRPLLELLEDRCAPAVFNVNSLADILMPPAGTVTLRSAIEAANSTPGGNTINLTLAGTYQITLAGTAGETDNAAGEFAILPAGGNLTIQNTSGGSVIVDGGRLNNRDFDINPANTIAGITVTMAGFTIQDGIATSAANPDGPAASGGGIRDLGNANLTLQSMVIANNAATADGGGIAMENPSESTFWSLFLNQTTISDNRAGDSGGGIETDGKGTVSINAGCVIEGNKALIQGGGVYLDGIANAVSSVTITHGGSDYLTAPTVTFSAPPSGTTATGIATVNLKGQVTGVVITNGGSGYTTAPTVTFSPPPTGDTATATASVVASQSANLTMTGSVVASNMATGMGSPIDGNLNGGGGISNAGDGAVTIAASTIADNSTASSGGGYCDQGEGLGTLTISNSLFKNNSAAGSSGGIFVLGSASFVNTSIEGNITGGPGGGLLDGLLSTGGTLTVTNCTISGNTAGIEGGGIELGGQMAVTITNSTITGNNVLAKDGGDSGGGIDVPATGGLGDPFGFSGSLSLRNDTITGNYAPSGGGIFWGGEGSGISVQNTVIATNIAGTSGPDAANTSGTFTDNGGNLIGIAGTGSGNSGFTASTTQTGTVANPLNPQLGPLQNNGGPTIGAPASPGTVGTELPHAGSPVIDRGVAAGAPTADERGYLRPEDTGGDLPDVGALEFLSSQERFVQALYLDELGRPGTLAELDGWVKVLNGSGGQAAVVGGVAGSFEARDRVVKGWYQTYLGRTAMNGEETFWANLLASQTQEQALSELLNSAEFFAHAQTLGFSGSANSQFVQALYSLLLNRTPGSSEINSWLNLLPLLGRQGVATDFLLSQEYRMDIVQTDYITLLHRIGDNLGVNHWVTSNLDLANIRLSLESSPEFFGIG
jgi:hypothetical protein